eukprot:753299-Pelagomonas_calceolata.AAC.2
MRRQIAYAQPAPLSDRRNRQAEQGYQATSKSENFSPRRDVKDYGPGCMNRIAKGPGVRNGDTGDLSALTHSPAHTHAAYVPHLPKWGTP